MLLKTSFPYKEISEGCTFLSGFAFKSEEFSEIGIPVVKIKNIQNKKVDFTDSQCFPESLYHAKLDKFKVHHKDILIAMTGQGSVGRVGQLKIDENDFGLLNQRVGRFICDEHKLNRDYLFYILTSDRYQEHLFDKAVGSGQPNLSPSDITSVEIPFPIYEEQISIASILSAIDDKIENNLQMNKTLEEMATALYKHWFVDFGPFREGEFVDSELGRIPKGWIVKLFGEVVSKYIDNRGKTPPITENGIPLLEVKHISSNLFPELTVQKYVTIDTYNSWFRSHLENNDIIISTVGTIGLTALVPKNSTVCIAQNLLGIRFNNNSLPRSFMFYLMKSPYFLNQIDNRLVITVQKSIKRQDLDVIPVLIPNFDYILYYSSKVEDYLNLMESNISENQTLTTLRDTLLPKLISGEVRVKEFAQN